jgi:hypothetical protein
VRLLRSLLTASLALSASACAPTLPALLAAHRYDEAICLNDDGAFPRKNDRAVMAPIEASLRATVKLHVATKEELYQPFAGASSEVRARAIEASKRVFVVQIRIETQPTVVHEASVLAYIEPAQDHFTQLHDRKELSAFVHEELPQSHQEGPGVTGTIAAWGRDVAQHPIANFLTLGVWSALNGPPATSTTVAPTDEDFQRMAPITVGLLGAFPSGWVGLCAHRPGLPCDSSFIYERPKDEGNAPIKLRFTVSAEASEEGGLFGRDRACAARHSVDVELPTGGTIEERFALAFGEGAHLISELDRPKKRALPGPLQPGRIAPSNSP